MIIKSIRKIVVLGLLTLASVSYPVYADEINDANTTEATVKNLENIAGNYIENESQIAGEAAGIIKSTVIADQAKLRENPTPEADIINFLVKGLEVTVKERVDDFYLVEIGELKGYIYKEQIDETKLAMVPYTSTVPKPVEQPITKSVSRGEEVVEYAKQFIGNPYVYGGNSLTTGVDCSGFTSQIYKKFGINLQRSSRAQYSGNGYGVPKADVKPGDLVFYGYNGYIDHVAIYAGNSQIVHANSSKTGIIMSKFEYGKPIVGIKRVMD
ncbi:MAG: NlpC/P60 family protein [Cellulosilyticaceae bacterium]